MYLLDGNIFLSVENKFLPCFCSPFIYCYQRIVCVSACGRSVFIRLSSIVVLKKWHEGNRGVWLGMTSPQQRCPVCRSWAAQATEKIKLVFSAPNPGWWWQRLTPPKRWDKTRLRRSDRLHPRRARRCSDWIRRRTGRTTVSSWRSRRLRRTSPNPEGSLEPHEWTPPGSRPDLRKQTQGWRRGRGCWWRSCILSAGCR